MRIGWEALLEATHLDQFAEGWHEGKAEGELAASVYLEHTLDMAPGDDGLCLQSV